MRNRFDEQLALLKKELIEMGALCEEVIAKASEALTRGDASYQFKHREMDEMLEKLRAALAAKEEKK